MSQNDVDDTRADDLDNTPEVKDNPTQAEDAKLEKGEDEEVEKTDAAKESGESEDGGDKGGDEDEDPPKPQGAMKRRIDKLTSQKWEEKRARMVAESQLTELQIRLRALEDTLRSQGKDPEGPGDRQLTEKDVEALAEVKAAQKAAELEFNNQCNKIWEEGNKRFGAGFETALGNFRDIGGLTTTMVEAAFATDDPAAVLYKLGQDRDRADVVRSMPLAKQVATMTKLLAPAPPKKISAAPAPVAPVRGSAKPVEPALEDPKLTTEQWMRLREKQLQAKRA